MCGNPFKRPKVETPKPSTLPVQAQVETVKVPDPTPTQVTDLGKDATADIDKKQKKRRGYAATRAAEDRTVLTDATASKDTLG